MHYLAEVLYPLTGRLCPAHAVLVDVRCPRPHSLFGCVLYDVPKPHSSALVENVSDGEFVLPAAADELAVVAEGLTERPLAAADELAVVAEGLVERPLAAADELAVVAEGLIGGHPLAAAWFALHAFASNVAAAVADGRRALGLEHYLVALPAVAAAHLAADAKAHTLAAQDVEKVLGAAVEGPLYVSHVSISHVSPDAGYARLPELQTVV